MNINIYIKTKNKNEQHLCVGIIEAEKNGKILKKDIIKNIVFEINDFLNDIKNRFTKGISSSMNISIFSNSLFNKNIIKEIFFTEIKELNSDIEFSEYFLELEQENICPAFIYDVKDTPEENEILLYLISSFFQNNIHLIFEFPLYLHMKSTGIIEEDYEVEALVEDKYLELLKFNNE